MTGNPHQVLNIRWFNEDIYELTLERNGIAMGAIVTVLANLILPEELKSGEKEVTPEAVETSH
ncbi:MAG: hypothetical protein ACPG5T_02985 [Endozoicomonas sp.]